MDKDKKIKEIAEWLNCGMKVCMHKETGEIVFFPDKENFSEMEMVAWGDELNKVENKTDEFWIFQNFDSEETRAQMREFVVNLDEKKSLQKRLMNSLRRSDSYRNFKASLNSFGGYYRKIWSKFSLEKTEEFVRQQMTGFNNGQEMA